MSAIKTTKNTLKVIAFISLISFVYWSFFTPYGQRIVLNVIPTALFHAAVVAVGVPVIVIENTANEYAIVPFKKWSAWQEVKDMEEEGVISKIDKTETKKGIDKDGNGIRDDVDSLIEAKSDFQELTAVLKELARGYQEVQEANEENLSIYLSYREKVGKGNACLREYTNVKGVDLLYIGYMIKALSLNTEKRKEWFSKFENFKSHKDDSPYICNNKEFRETIYKHLY